GVERAGPWIESLAHGAVRFPVGFRKQVQLRHDGSLERVRQQLALLRYHRRNEMVGKVATDEQAGRCSVFEAEPLEAGPPTQLYLRHDAALLEVLGIVLEAAILG